MKFRPFSLSDTNLAFTWPMRKGTSQYRSIRDVSKALKAERKTWVSPLQPSVVRLLKAAKANGHDPYRILMMAKGKVAHELYEDFFSAYYDGDFRKLDQIADKIQNYDLITERGIKQSLSVRDLDKAQVEDAIKRFKKGGREFVTREKIAEKYGVELPKKKTTTAFPRKKSILRGVFAK